MGGYDQKTNGGKTMKAILSIFVALMLLLSGISVAFAQNNVTNENVTDEDLQDEVEDEVETEVEDLEEEEVEVEEEDVDEEDVEEEVEDETFELKGGKQYSLLSRALDRIRLAFTLQEERKLELMDKMQQKREDHYNFLLAKGKTEQAERFKERTTGLVRNFDNYRSQKQEVLQRIENRAEEVKERAAVTDSAERRTAAEEAKERRGQRP